MTTYCAPCVTDLALLRDAVTAVGGTACCAAHAVLLTHPHDAHGRRRARLAQLRSLAEAKAATAPVEDQPGLELLMHEYTLAGAMDMGGQPRPDGSQQRAERPERPDRAERPERPGEPGTRPGKRRGRGRGDRPERPAGERHDGAPVSEPAPASDPAPDPAPDPAAGPAAPGSASGPADAATRSPEHASGSTDASSPSVAPDAGPTPSPGPASGPAHDAPAPSAVSGNGPVPTPGSSEAPAVPPEPTRPGAEQPARE